jgi:hypothetical protein
VRRSLPAFRQARGSTPSWEGTVKSIVAFVGSGRKHGVTYRATRQFLDGLQSLGDVQTDIVFLSEQTIGLCRGCKACFSRGEAFCPLHARLHRPAEH